MTDTVMSISVLELCQNHGLTEQVIVEVVDHGIARPLTGSRTSEWAFDITSVHWLRKAVRLHADLEIDWIAVAMVIDLLRENEALQRRNQCFEQQLKRFLEAH